MNIHLISRSLGLAFVLLVGLASLIGSDNRGSFTTPPELGLSISNVSSDEPDFLEVVTIEWDYENPERLSAQGIRIMSLLIDGNLFQQQAGCLPFYEPDQDCLPLERREVTLPPFKAPITVFIDSIDDAGRLESKAVKLRIPGMSFTLTQYDNNQPNYPRNLSENLEFDRVFGIYAAVEQSAEEDGIIDDIAALNLVGFDQQASDGFFGHSWSPYEAEDFAFRKGSRFPLLDASFVAGIDKEPLWKSNHADALIFAGAIAINGTQETLKVADGEEIPIYVHATESDIEPVFVQIDIRSTDETTTTLHPSELRVGNIAQGLSLSVYHGQYLVGSTMGNAEIDPMVSTPDPKIVTSTGSIKGAFVAHQVTDATGNVIGPVGAGVSLEWSNVPFYPDDDLSGLLNTYDDREDEEGDTQ